jgi:hypothetical protein
MKASGKRFVVYRLAFYAAGNVALALLWLRLFRALYAL